MSNEFKEGFDCEDMEAPCSGRVIARSIGFWFDSVSRIALSEGLDSALDNLIQTGNPVSIVID